MTCLHCVFFVNLCLMNRSDQVVKETIMSVSAQVYIEHGKILVEINMLCLLIKYHLSSLPSFLYLLHHTETNCFDVKEVILTRALKQPP